MVSVTNECPKACERPAGKRAQQRAARRAAIVQVARRHFQEHGYGGSTMSAIAADLGGSKGTLWAHFASKEELFAATLDDLISEFAHPAPLPEEADPAETLTAYATEFVTMLLSPPVVALYRLIIAEAHRFPELGRIFYDRAPARRYRAFAAYLAAQTAAGRLDVPDPQLASTQFHLLCQHRLFVRRLWALPTPDGPGEIARDAAASVRLFLDGCRASARPV